MQYKPLITKAYDKLSNIYNDLKSLFKEEDYSSVYIKNPGPAARLWLALFDRYKAQATRVTPENFDEMFQQKSKQLKLPLEERIK